MKERNWTMYRLAKESNLPWSTLRNMFKRNTDPSIQTLEAICRGMGITLSQFFDENNNNSLAPEQIHLLYQWSLLCEKDRELVIQLISALQR